MYFQWLFYFDKNIKYKDTNKKDNTKQATQNYNGNHNSL